MIELVKNIKDKIDLRSRKQKEGSKILNEIMDQTRKINQLIKEKEEIYNETLDDTVLNEIADLKEKIENLKEQSSIIVSTGILNSYKYPCSADEIETALKQLDQKVDSIKFDELSSNVKSARESYIKSLEAYQEGVDMLLDERQTIVSVKGNLEKETLKAFHNWFIQTHKGIFLDPKLKVGNIEAAMFTKIKETANQTLYLGGFWL
jgi:hypothetical protein